MRRDRVVASAVTAVSLALAAVACAPPVRVASPDASARSSPSPATSAPPVPVPVPAAQPAGRPAEPPAAPKQAAPKAAAPATATALLLPTLLARGGPALRGVLAAASTHRFQVLLTLVHEGASPSLERHVLRPDAEYVFPASSMKVPIALAAAERLAALRRSGHPALTRDALLRLYGPHAGVEPYVTSLAREAFRALVVSDNAAANRLLGIVGHREVHETLWGLGLSSVRVRTGFATGGELDPATVSPRIEVLEQAGQAGQAGQDELPARQSDLALPATEATGLAIGKASIEGGRLVAGPMSFADKNAIRLADLQEALVRIVRPDLVPAGAKHGAPDPADLAYLARALGTLPSASGLAGYDRNVVADYQLVPFLRGLERVRPRAQLQIFSKVGQAYGFLLSNAYVVEKATGRAFFLTAAVYADADETVNDDRYDYDSVAFPALADLAEVAARHAFDPAPP